MGSLVPATSANLRAKCVSGASVRVLCSTICLLLLGPLEHFDWVCCVKTGQILQAQKDQIDRIRESARHKAIQMFEDGTLRKGNQQFDSQVEGRSRYQGEDGTNNGGGVMGHLLLKQQ